MKDFLKKKWQVVLIFLLVLFGLSKCTQSCNRASRIDELETECSNLDSINNVYKDSVVSLKHQVELLYNDKSNQDKLLETQKDALTKINEAKKNINVTVRK